MDSLLSLSLLLLMTFLLQSKLKCVTSGHLQPIGLACHFFITKWLTSEKINITNKAQLCWCHFAGSCKRVLPGYNILEGK